MDGEDTGYQERHGLHNAREDLGASTLLSNHRPCVLQLARTAVAMRQGHAKGMAGLMACLVTISARPALPASPDCELTPDAVEHAGRSHRNPPVPVQLHGNLRRSRQIGVWPTTRVPDLRPGLPPPSAGWS